jgi:hypothetical protein
MIIQSKTIVAAAAAFGLVGAILWGSSTMLTPDKHPGSVQITSVDNEKAWSVEIKPADETRQASLKK